MPTKVKLSVKLSILSIIALLSFFAGPFAFVNNALATPPLTATLTVNGSHSTTVVAPNTVAYAWVASDYAMNGSSRLDIYNTSTGQVVSSDACGNSAGDFS